MKKVILGILFPFLLNATSLQHMISQMIIVGFNGQSEDEKWVKQIMLDIKTQKIGGVYLQDENIQSKKQVKKLILNLKNVQKEQKIFIFSDQQGGKKSYFTEKKDFLTYPSISDIAKYKTLQTAQLLNESMAKELSDIGINFNNSPTLNGFSEYSSISTSYAMTFLDSFNNANIISSVKYFPIDLHVNFDYENIRIYYDLIHANYIKSITLSKGYLKQFDENNPICMSEKIINILKNDLNYKGLILCDSLEDKALKNISLEEKLIKSINAGVNILVFKEYFFNNSNIVKNIHDLILKNINNGKINKDNIINSYKKIMDIKKLI